ncbi:MAG TPA: helix-turn-helix domain-containing protein [Pyrinomonadaceae bacterium]|nr:helix-turn-helix domain-containing protein [Pyrinomonadaceae bacterium]
MAAIKVTLGTGERRDVGNAGAAMDERIKRVIVEMEKHLDSELSLDVLAQSVNLSTSRFRHLFKAETGTTPAQYLKSLRMSRAKKLVETTFLNIKQIMCSIGVRDKRHFAKDFERTYGLTPTQYRARLRGAGRGSN